MDTIEPTGDVLFIRHGKTRYTQEGLDLTPEGIEETKDQARKLAEQIENYDEVIVISSPLARAQGTAKVFLDEIGIQVEPRIMETIRCVDVYDEQEFLAYNRDHSTSVYGHMWFHDEAIRDDNDFMEGTQSVKRRSLNFLRHMTTWAGKKANYTGKKVCVLAFTHFEVASNYLQLMYDGKDFPSSENPGLENSGVIKISSDLNDSRFLDIQARGISRRIRIDETDLIVEES